MLNADRNGVELALKAQCKYDLQSFRDHINDEAPFYYVRRCGGAAPAEARRYSRAG